MGHGSRKCSAEPSSDVSITARDPQLTARFGKGQGDSSRSSPGHRHPQRLSKNSPALVTAGSQALQPSCSLPPVRTSRRRRCPQQSRQPFLQNQARTTSGQRTGHHLLTPGTAPCTLPRPYRRLCPHTPALTNLPHLFPSNSCRNIQDGDHIMTFHMAPRFFTPFSLIIVTFYVLLSVPEPQADLFRAIGGRAAISFLTSNC